MKYQNNQSNRSRNAVWLTFHKVGPALLLSGSAACCVSSGYAQEVVLFQNPVPTVVQSTVPQKSASKHLGSGPIDMNNLSQDILNCDVCRQRLGLPPLDRSASNIKVEVQVSPSDLAKSQPAKVEQVDAAPIRMLGSPGLISSGTADRMAQSGLVVEEFKPPQPEAGALDMSGLPREVRQQFLQSLDLPKGARVMSANVLGAKKGDVESTPAADAVVAKESKKAVLEQTQNSGSKAGGEGQRSLGAPGIVPAPEPVIATKISDGENPVEAKADAKSEALSTKPNETEPSPGLLAEKPNTESKEVALPKPEQALKDQSAEVNLELQETLRKVRERERDASMRMKQLEEQAELMRQESEKRIARFEESNREVVKLLEARTAEVSSLQAALKERELELQQAKEKLDAKKKSSKKDESKRKPKENEDL